MDGFRCKMLVFFFYFNVRFRGDQRKGLGACHSGGLGHRSYTKRQRYRPFFINMTQERRDTNLNKRVGVIEVNLIKSCMHIRHLVSIFFFFTVFLVLQCLSFFFFFSAGSRQREERTAAENQGLSSSACDFVNES